jgi:hypothetical protein
MNMELIKTANEGNNYLEKFITILREFELFYCLGRKLTEEESLIIKQEFERLQGVLHGKEEACV